MAKLFVITGPAGVGKSTVTNALADRLSKCAVLEGDEIYNQVKSGCVKPWLEGNHTDLMWKNIICLARNYLEADFDVILNYIIYKDRLEFLMKELSDYDIHFVVLMAKRETVQSRDVGRGEEFAVKRVDNHISKFLSQSFDDTFYLQTDNKSVNQEVEEILKGKFKIN